MKLLVPVVVVLMVSACATGPKRSKANLSIDSEPSPVPAARSTTPASAGDDHSPEGEIELGLEGDRSGSVVVEKGFAAEDEGAAEADEEKLKPEAVTTPRKKSNGWATGNSDEDFEDEPEDDFDDESDEEPE